MDNPTTVSASQLFQKYSNLYSLEEGSPEFFIDKEDFTVALIEFAKFHVAAALKAASVTDFGGCYDNTHIGDDRYGNDKNAILTAYPLSNIVG